ncbi:bacteriocin-like protein [Chryseobacterium sp. CFS7]|uniref:bacteriocin-like protein n=1 Tax=unclassified Chryseobacterium TaxID=2593645 RepID=UPI0038CFDC37
MYCYLIICIKDGLHFFTILLFQPNNLLIMKNLKKIGRQNLKSITRGRPPAESECIACGCLTSAY